MPISKRQRVADRVLSRLLGQTPALTSYGVESVRTPMRDGIELVGDHFIPESDQPRGTVLIRTPYGRGLPTSALNGRLLAARGYHVLLQSVRGTFGSGGTFRPMAQETEDGRDTVAWLRDQPWFDGRLATLGASYLGWAQWTLMQDPPPELRAAVIYVGPHDFREAVFGTGAFTLGDFLGWSDQMAHQEDGGGLRRLLSMATARRRIAPGLTGLPLPTAAVPVLRGRAPWYREWLAHPDGDDPWWEPYRAGSALQRASVPVLLISGWQNLFLDQTLQQYAALEARGVDVALTVGPWTHLQVATRAAGQVARESVAWLDQHLAGGPSARKQPVRVHRTGEGAWHELPSWPPPTEPVTFHLRADRSLTTAAPARPEGNTGFRYDPADPTPSVGGRTLTGSMGVRDNRTLESRADVVTFTTDPLPTAVDVVGAPVLELAVDVDNPHADVFVRLCDVDRRGHSRNFSDQHVRLDPQVPAGQVQRLTLTLDQCFHRLPAGHRLRLQVSGGAFPRFARNLGTPGDPATGRHLAPSLHTLHLAGSHLLLPVAS
ncbi:CocE/NonD family hydrolase [Actinoplanes sp. NPDC024001]|uniref:CocE/NonD family hydrolase n=1 Tax=Actinoplanes sp. NPDC024001 TaxID=3154598 RepID=UPI0033EA69D4